MKTKTTGRLAFFIVIIGVIGLSYLVWPDFESLPGDDEIVLYKSPSCGCCEKYVPYLRNAGISPKVVNKADLSGIKSKIGVPLNLESCHTMVIDGYFVEGHVPIEAIVKLRKDKPDIAGIALAGMPAGSPGMGGEKTGPFRIYAVHHDGSVDEFMTV